MNHGRQFFRGDRTKPTFPLEIFGKMNGWRSFSFFMPDVSCSRLLVSMPASSTTEDSQSCGVDAGATGTTTASEKDPQSPVKETSPEVKDSSEGGNLFFEKGLERIR